VAVASAALGLVALHVFSTLVSLCEWLARALLGRTGSCGIPRALEGEQATDDVRPAVPGMTKDPHVPRRA
jgi:hypothetical protein